MKPSLLSTIKYAGLLLFSIFLLSGCLKEGEDIAHQLTPQLVVIPSKTVATQGDTINFDILLFGELVEADLFINNQKISGISQVFTEDGIYKVHAQKEGVENSDTVKIQIGESKGLLELVPSATNITVGDSVMFTTLSSGDNIDADIYVNGIKLTGDKRIFYETGTFKAYALKEGYIDSDTLEIKVYPKSQLILTASSTEVFVGDKDTFHVTVNGQSVTDAEIYINGNKLTDSVYLFNAAGIYTVFAKKAGFSNSDTIEIIASIKPKLSLSIPKKEAVVDEYINILPMYFHDGMGKQIKDAEIYVDNVLTQMVSMEGGFPLMWKSNTAGVFEIYAAKEGYVNSDTIEVVVKEKPKLELTQKTGVTQGMDGTKYYSFEVKYDGDPVAADLYKDGVKQSGLSSIPFTPRPEAYKIYAKKSGYINSDTLEFVVEDTRPQLVITPSETEVVEGTKVTFSVKMIVNGQEQPATDIQIYLDSNLISGYQYTFATAGTFQVMAKGFGGVRDSDPVTITVTANTGSINVHVVGFDGGGGSSSIAKYWQNTAANATTLGDGKATDIFNFNGGFYISGYEMSPGAFGKPIKAKYWDNNQNAIVLDNGNSQANSIRIEPVDGGVVVGGGVDSNAAYWLWGQKNIVGTDPGYEIIMNDAIWTDGEIYAVGNKRENWQSSAIIWANGDSWALYNSGYSVANAIELKGGDYYVAGMAEGIAVYWENGTINYLTTPSGLSATANDIAFNNSNIYIAGVYESSTERDYAVVWMNGTMYKLTGDSEQGHANAIAVASDGTIYVAGWKSTTTYSETIATYWQIDESGNILKEVALTDGTEDAEATGISVVD